MRRNRVFFEKVLYEKGKVSKFGPKTFLFYVFIRFDADFQDMFVVRGFMGGKLGGKRDNRVLRNEIAFGYDGSDGIGRELKVGWSGPEGIADADGQVTFALQLGPAESTEIDFYLLPVF